MERKKQLMLPCLLASIKKKKKGLKKVYKQSNNALKETKKRHKQA